MSASAELYGIVADSVLAEHHLASLEIDSSISPERVRERGYFTARHPHELAELGFADWQRNVPALVIPVHGVDGEVRFYRARPDNPRSGDKPGKRIKYEQPAGSPLALDVPPCALPFLSDRSRRLWIVEGEKKADALASRVAERGECIVALLGVWAWKRDGLPLPDWDSIPLVGRDVCICFDSDAAEKAEILHAERSLAEYLEGRGARG